MITIVTWKWRAPGYRSEYLNRHVNALYHQVQANLKMPHRFVCVTDDPKNVACETIPIWDGPLSHQIHHKRPNCYRRLLAFRPEIEELFGPTFVSMDVDALVIKDLDPLFEPLASGETDFMIYGGNTHPTTPYNGSMWGMKAGARRQVWDQFDPETTPMEAQRNRFYGSDQAIISFLLGRGERTWSQKDGVYNYRTDLRGDPLHLPEDARLVFFAGRLKPWYNEMRAQCPWIDKTGVTY